MGDSVAQPTPSVAEVIRYAIESRLPGYAFTHDDRLILGGAVDGSMKIPIGALCAGIVSDLADAGWVLR